MSSWSSSLNSRLLFFFFFFDEKEDSDDDEHEQDRQTFKDVNELIAKFVGYRLRAL